MPCNNTLLGNDEAWREGERERDEKTPAEIIICSVTNLLCIQIEMRELNTTLFYVYGVCAGERDSSVQIETIKLSVAVHCVKWMDAWSVRKGGISTHFNESHTEQVERKN